MNPVYIFIDVVSLLFTSAAATIAGERVASEISPNVLVLVIVFFLARAALYYVFFRSVVQRKLSLVRNAVQSISLIILLSVAAFIFTVISTYIANTDTKFFSALLNLTNTNGFIFYFLIAPLMMVLISIFVHKFYKIESL